MTTPVKWYEWVTGSLVQKRQYKRYKSRVGELPRPYRDAHEGLERYLTIRGGITQGDEFLQMLEDLADLMEQAATERTALEAVIGEDAVEFAEDFLSNYTDSQWINKERERLRTTVAAAIADASP